MQSRHRKGLILLLSLALATLLTTTAPAATVGTDAGTLIGNTAQITYSIGGVAQGPENSTTATIVVDNLVDLSMAGTDTASVNGADQAVLFTIENTGNETQSYRVAFYAEGLTDDHDMDFTDTNSGLYIDSDASGDYSAGDTLIQLNPVSGTYYPINVDVAPDGTVDILLVGTTPAGVSSGETSTYSLVAQVLDDAATDAVTTDDGATADDPATIDVVFADGEAQSTAAVNGVPANTDIVQDGKYLATATYTFQGSGVTVSKSYAVLWDPINGNSNPKAIPGAYVKYTLVVSNAAGSPAAILNQITDSLNAALAIDPDLIDGTTFPAAGDPESVAGNGFKVVHATGRASTPATQYFTTANDADGVDHSGGLVTATFATILPAEGVTYSAGELLPGETVTLYFNAIIQ
ncbi:MAG: hypothetical protein RQ754_12940 [Desulfuromonadales bacterium]|nr:hypothetical protein [Desulfuromonadales bacterium]